MPSLCPLTTCLGLGDRPPLLALQAPPSSARDAGALGLFPLPPAPYLTTSPSFSHHVRTSGHPQNAAQQPFRRKSERGDRLGTHWLEPRPGPCCAASPRTAHWTLRTAAPQLPGAARLSMSRSPALLLLLRAPLDRIGQQCGVCHWPGEADGALIGRARARGAPHSTVSERFETPKAPQSVRGGEGARQGRNGKKWAWRSVENTVTRSFRAPKSV